MILISSCPFNKIYLQAKYTDISVSTLGCYPANPDKTMIRAIFFPSNCTTNMCYLLTLNIHDKIITAAENLISMSTFFFLLVVQSYIRSQLPQLFKYHSSSYVALHCQWYKRKTSTQSGMATQKEQKKPKKKPKTLFP